VAAFGALWTRLCQTPIIRNVSVAALQANHFLLLTLISFAFNL
jgi:hypothetical protein